MTGLGIDLIEIERIEKAITQYGNHFTDKIFTQNEILYCKSKANPFHHFAARFAAKEAFAKAFGTGIGAHLGWHDIEVVREFTGKPVILMSRRIHHQVDPSKVLLSISHTHLYAVAAVHIFPQP